MIAYFLPLLLSSLAYLENKKYTQQIYFPLEKFSIDEMELALGSELAFILGILLY